MRSFILVFAVIYSVKGNMTVTPRNIVALAGERVEMECGVDNNSRIFRWDVRKPAKATETIVRIDISGSSVVNITHLGADVDNSGSGIIYYNLTELEDAGNYTCNAIRGSDDKMNYSAQLIVLESLPNCTSNYSSEIKSSIESREANIANFEAITMQCSVNFRGFWAPTMQWKQYDSDGTVIGKGRLVKDGIETQTISNSKVTSYLTVRRDSLREKGFFSCRTYFARTSDGILIMNATNIPDFVYVWNSSSFHNFASSYTNTTEQPGRKHFMKGMKGLWLTTVGVLLLLLVAIVTLASVYYIRTRQTAKGQRVQEVEQERELLATSPVSPYANERIPELHAYAEINESEISPVDNPPKTRPRLGTTSSSIVAYETGQVENHSETTSPIEPECASQVKPQANDDQLITEATPSFIYHVLDPCHVAANSGSPTSEVELTYL